MNRIMKLTWFWKCENYFCSGYLFFYLLPQFVLCLHFGLLVVLSSVRYLGSWMDLFCLKEYFTLVSWLMHSPHTSFLYTRANSGFKGSLRLCHVYTAEGKTSNCLLSFLSEENVQLLEIPAIEFFPEIRFVHCYLHFQSFRDCIVGKLATAVLTVSMGFTLRGV